jgi:hypothetical protein
MVDVRRMLSANFSDHGEIRKKVVSEPARTPVHTEAPTSAGGRVGVHKAVFPSNLHARDLRRGRPGTQADETREESQQNRDSK